VTKITKMLLLLVACNLIVAVALLLARPASSNLYLLGEDLRGHIGDDSSYFIELAFQLARTPQPLYSTLVMEQHKKFQYPTSSLLIGFAAEGLHTTMHGLVKWNVLISALLTLIVAGEIFLLVLPGVPGDARYRWQVRFLVAALGLLFYPLLNSVNLGQIQTLLTFLFTLAVWCWMRGWKAVTGVCLAVACAFKPPLALFLLWGLLRRQWRFVWAFLAIATAIQMLAILAFGWRHEVEYLAALSYLSRHGESIAENQSVNGWLQRWTRNGQDVPSTDYFPYPPYNALVYVGTLISTAALLLFGLLLPALRRWQGTASDFVLFGLISTIASPIVWTHHYGVFYVGFVFVLAMLLKQSGRMPALFILCFLVMANFWHFGGSLYGSRWFSPLFSYVLYAGLGILWLLAFRVKHGQNNAESGG